MQPWHKGPKAETVAKKKNENMGHTRRMATIFETTKGIGGWSSGQLSPLGRRAPAYKTVKKALDLEIVKQTNGMSSGFREIRKWALWRDRPPPKRKKRLQI
jgi:hypothetical protein